ncbi:PhnD/SsuA/transferrin family substrate-binding protein [Shewanella sp. NIFS-20-20]|nr:PhnD/SsuA/transferrin family substrate-binding protein [Shewanella sp. NIFS-20-20]
MGLLCGKSAFANNLEQAKHSPKTSLRVGVLANWGYQAAVDRWQPMMRYLESQVEHTSFQVHPGSFEELNLALHQGEIQFIVTNPGQYLFLSQQYPLSWLATMRSRQHNGTTSAIGSAIVVRADSDYRTLYDLSDKVIAASGRHALGGYQATVGLMHKLGMDPDHFFAQVKFLGFPLDALVYQVRDANVDAAITPLCTIEEMSQRGLINANDYRILNPSRPNGFDCQCSTNLYPNWSFAASERVDVALTKDITQALMQLPENHPAAIAANLKGWTSPISQLEVIKLFNDLQPPEQSVGSWQALKHWFDNNRHWGILAVFIFLIATIYHLWIEYKFRQKSEALLQSERQLKQKAIALERLQSAAIIGEIGAGLAHEINQPIAAITSYSEGGIMRLQRQGASDADTCIALLHKIHQQSMRAGDVVHRIRGLLKRRQAVMQDVNLLTLVDESIALLKLELARHQVQVSTQVKGEPYFVSADKVGIQQVIVNLIKNSLDAIAEQLSNEHAEIMVVFDFQPSQVNVQFIDNGTGLSVPSDELIATFYTTKEQGLGLGLAICNDVIKQHHGLLFLTNRPPPAQGCIAEIRLKRRGSEHAVS